jgi:C-terminal processing protease CtpA/Prc
MNPRPLKIFLPVTLFIATAIVVFPQSPASQLERDRGRAMLKVIKNDLKDNYYDPNFHGTDVEARFKASDEKMKGAKSQGQIFGIIAQFLMDFDDSHTYFIPPERAYTTEYGWQMQMIGDKCYVVAVRPGSDADSKGLKEGDQIVALEGFTPTRDNLWKLLYTFQALRPKPGLRLVVMKPGGQELQLDVMAKINQGKRVLDLTGNDIFDLIRQAENEERFHRHRYLEVGDGLIIWKMPAFDLEDSKVDEMVGKAKKRGALILDLRGNGGGYETTLLRMVSNFFDRDVKVGDIKRRKESKPLTAKTRGDKAFLGKLIVLIDSRSGSAAELFARIVQLEKRGVVIGDVSAGAVMRGKHYDHKHGLDVVMFYGASITDADIVMSDGKSLERVGVVPDELKLPTPAQLAAKLDPVLTYAASLAGVTMSPEKAGAMFPVEWRK